MANNIKEANVLKNEIEDYYRGTGYNIRDLLKYLKSISKGGYDESYDRSLLVVLFGNLQVIAGTNYVQFNLIHSLD